MEVILLQRVAKLGQMGDVVNVKPGYARNFLLPQGKALRSTEANKASFEAKRLELEARSLELRKDAEAVSERIAEQTYVIIRSASDTGSLYGSVTKRDAANAARENGVELDKMQFDLKQPIKELGLHQVSVSLHPEVEVEVTLNVARSEEEAKLQAAGKSVSELVDSDQDMELPEPDSGQSKKALEPETGTDKKALEPETGTDDEAIAGDDVVASDQDPAASPPQTDESATEKA